MQDPCLHIIQQLPQGNASLANQLGERQSGFKSSKHESDSKRDASKNQKYTK
jgi:hypothetical protein